MGDHYKMLKLPVPPIQDIARIVASSDDATLTNLAGYYDGGGSFNYDPIRRLSRQVFSRAVSLQGAQDHFLKNGNPAGRVENAAVAKLVWLAGDDALRGYDLNPRKYPIGAGVESGVFAPFFYLASGRYYLFWLQPRKSFAPATQQLGIIGSILRQFYLRDDLADADLTLLDASRPPGATERTTRIYRLSDLPLLEEKELSEIAGAFLRAYDRLNASGFQPKKRRRKGSKGDDLFPPP
jgi:hypothetical protein